MQTKSNNHRHETSPVIETKTNEILIQNKTEETEESDKKKGSSDKIDKNKVSMLEGGSTNKKSNFELFGFFKSIREKTIKSIDKQVVSSIIDQPNTTIDNEPVDEHSSGDEKLSKAFGVDYSYTRTPRVHSEQYTDSIELENPDVEKSMLTEELRTLKFCLNDDDENDEELPNSLNRPKNYQKIKNATFTGQKKGTSNETALNSGSVVIIRNKKEASLLSTQDSRKVPRNSAYKNHDNIYLKDLNETEVGGLSTVHEQGETDTSNNYLGPNMHYNNAQNYNMFEFGGNKDYHQYPQETQGFYFNHYVPNVDMSLIKGAGYSNMSHGYYSRYPTDQSSENKKQKKGKRNFWKVEDTSEFEIKINKIYQENKTTLMIRNIPNKYTKELMLETIDAHFKGSYDFFYLPIDFKNNCNVGYAFINFKDLRFIEPFCKRFNQKKWAIFNSEKICSIKYARIQGKEECEKHFKDSSLMKQTVR